jgi:general secretion pathway protein B
MSYILDALRRADAERESGAVPSIHSQSLGPAPRGTPKRVKAPPSRLPWLIFAGLALAMLTLVAMWWWSSSRDAPMVPVAPVAPVAPPSLPAPASVPPVVAAAPALGALQVAPTAAPPTPAPATVSAPVVAQPAAISAVPRPRPAPASSSPTAPAQATPAAAKPLPTAEPRTVARNELPPDVQRVLPPLAMSGSVYSPDARNRMVIVDGRLMMEGEPVAQGLVVERINPKSVVMRYQNHRFNVPL